MKFKVVIIESERGWGQRIDEVRWFDSADYDGDADKALDAARNFVREFNSTNNEPTVPDWYMKALAPEVEDAS